MNLIEWVELPDLGDHRGSLVVAEANKNIPFNIQRLIIFLALSLMFHVDFMHIDNYNKLLFVFKEVVKC